MRSGPAGAATTSQRRVATAACVLATAALGGLGALAVLGTGAAAGDAPRGVCPQAKTDGDAVRCTALYPGSRPLRLPADPSDTVRYGAFRRGDGTHLVTRSGMLKLSSALAAQVGQAAGSSGGSAYAKTVYLATVSGGTVTAIKPAVTIAERAILQHVFGGKSLEGRIGAAVPKTGTYTEAVKLPIRVQLAVSTTTGVLAGRIVNAARSVRSAGGQCLAPLTKSGARNPLTGRVFTAKIGLQRRPSMHAPFDDVLIARWNASASDMGEAFYPSVATLMGKDPLGPLWEAHIHGVPNLGPALYLRFVTKGGGSC